MISIHHTGDGTVVDGTDRSDAPDLKACGFRWSSRQQFWFLPRTWTEPTRAQRAQELADRLDDRAELKVGDLARSTSAEHRAEQHVTRANELAERHAARAESAQQQGDILWDRARESASHIPLGQPILLSHHSEGRHRAHLARINRLDRQAVEQFGRARDEQQRARASAAEAAGYDDPARVARRIATARTELRRWQQWPADNERATAKVQELTDQIARDEAALAASPAAGYNRDTVRAGDAVKVRSSWHLVEKSNPKTFAVVGFGLHLTYPYTEIQAHRSAAELNPADLRQVLAARHSRDLQDSLRNRRLRPESRQLIEDILAERAAAGDG